MAQDNTLDILIRTLADQSGAQLTVEQLQKVKERTAELNATVEKNTSAYKGATEEQKRAAQAALAQLNASDKVKEGTRNLSHELHGLKEAGTGAREVMEGLERGGFGGLIQSGKGVINIVKGLGTGALGGVLIPAIAAAGAGLVYLNSVLEKTKEEMKKTWDDAAKAREVYAAGVEANTARIKKALEEELKAIDKITEAYERRQKAIDKGKERDDRLRDPSRALRDTQLDNAEKAELAKTKDPLKQAKIKSTYERLREKNKIRDTLGDFSSSDYAADDNTRNARDAIYAAQEQNRGADISVMDAEREFKAAVDATKAFKPQGSGRYDRKGNEIMVDDGSAEAVAARTRAKLAKDNLDKVKGSRDSIYDRNSKLIESAQAAIDAAALQKEETAIRRAAYLALVNQRSKDAATPEDRKAIESATTPFVEKTPGKAGSGGVITRGGETLKIDGANAVEKLVETGKVLSKTLKTVGDFADKTTKVANDTRTKLTRLQQAGPGGGG